MNRYSMLTSALVVALGLSAPAALAQTDAPPAAGNENVRNTDQPNPAVNADPVAHGNTIDDEDFIEEASAKGFAEIETAKMALERGTDAVKDFAQYMIDEHGEANEKMRELANKHDLDISDDPTLMDRAKALTLRVREGESFDRAYANNQVSAHEQAIELFRRASNSENADISEFANMTLPKLEEHLDMARALARETGATEE